MEAKARWPPFGRLPAAPAPWSSLHSSTAWTRAVRQRERGCLRVERSGSVWCVAKDREEGEGRASRTGQRARGLGAVKAFAALRAVPRLRRGSLPLQRDTRTRGFLEPLAVGWPREALSAGKATRAQHLHRYTRSRAFEVNESTRVDECTEKHGAGAAGRRPQGGQ